MSQYAPVTCIVCDTTLQNVFIEADCQPSEGTSFYTSGNYGSTAFDPLDGSKLQIVICDVCLRARQDRVLWFKASIPVTCGKWGIVGWKDVDRPTVHWNGNGSFDDTETEEVDWSVVGDADYDKHVHWNAKRLHGPDPYVQPTDEWLAQYAADFGDWRTRCG